ncbi:ATP-dependent Zn protease [Luminiphilus syltensis NOR5-1B]|uniref:ATP-dependent Zn protease n=1 Tax=Luminiphilus syltensis NOR5-1B TaxID=565045 RepID=B8KVD3_9GAMM|nr:RimK/LysX family protein [Luminiphilus syltensis]EED34765.1 ATP-dependent Zn protease [Luminiphilus syltensis NOR5-1B]
MVYHHAIKKSRQFIPIAVIAALSSCAVSPQLVDPELAKMREELSTCRVQHSELLAGDKTIVDGLAKLGSQFTKIESELAAMQAKAACPPVKEAPSDPPISIAALQEPPEPQKLVVGRNEQIWVEDLQLALPARIDTGAETASLDARNITAFERDGESWVRFDIPDPTQGNQLTLERPLVRNALIIQANSEEPERRHVIELGIQIGNIRQMAEFTLSDRSHLDYQMLVGRNILQDVMLVDVSGVNLVALPRSIDKTRSPTSGE